MAGLDAFGCALERSDMDSTPTFTEIASVTSISGPSISRNTYDVTAHDSPDAYMEFIGGLKDGGEISFDLNWDPTDSTHFDLASDLDDPLPRDYKLVLPQGIAEWNFAAILTGFSGSQPVDDKLTAAVTYKITGKPTLDIGSS